MREVESVSDVEQMTLPSQSPAVSLMDQLLSEPGAHYRELKYGDVVEGLIMQVDRDEILVDIGSKSEGVIPSKELSTLSEPERAQPPSPGAPARPASRQKGAGR